MKSLGSVLAESFFVIILRHLAVILSVFGLGFFIAAGFVVSVVVGLIVSGVSCLVLGLYVESEVSG